MKLNIYDVQLEVDNCYDEIGDTAKEIIKAYTEQLDSIVDEINKNIIKPSNYDKYLITDYFLKLSSEVYHVNSDFDKVRLYQTISNLVYSNKYNIVYLNNRLKDSEKKNKMTVAELNAIAENDTVNEKTMSAICDIVADTIKNKVTSANTLIATLSKILNVCMQENSLELNTNIKQRHTEKETIYG